MEKFDIERMLRECVEIAKVLAFESQQSLIWVNNIDKICMPDFPVIIDTDGALMNKFSGLEEGI